jgi:predicted dehydrogenase
MTAPVAMALVGAGQVGKRHLAHILAEPTVRLHAIVDPDEAARAVAAEAGAPWFPDIASMLAAGKPDAAMVASPNPMHVAHGLAFIAAGIPVMVEKPIADDPAGARKLVAEAGAAGVPLMVGHHRRHNPMIAEARAAIASGRLGRVIAVHGFFWLMKPDSYFEVPWRRQKGAGPVLMNLIHDIDLLRHLCGEISEVQALQSNAVRGHPIDETTVMTMRFSSGTLGTMTVSDTVVSPWSWEHTASEFRDYPRTDQCCFMVAGTRGAISIPRLEIWTHDGAPDWFRPFRTERLIAPEVDPFRQQVRHIARVARGEEQPLVSGEEGLRTLLAVAAVQEAAATGRLVKVEA